MLAKSISTQSARAVSVNHDPWSKTVRLLGLLSNDDVVTAPRSKDSGQRTRQSVRCRPSVVVLDRPSTMTVTVQWCDSTSGRYGDQVWRVGISKESAVCVLTGARIKMGDAIYRPRACGQSPLNAREMILASSIDGALRC